MSKLLVKDNLNYEARTRICGEHGKGVNKSIDVIINPALDRIWYEFRNNKKCIYKGPSIDEAIIIYNKFKKD